LGDLCLGSRRVSRPIIPRLPARWPAEPIEPRASRIATLTTTGSSSLSPASEGLDIATIPKRTSHFIFFMSQAPPTPYAAAPLKVYSAGRASEVLGLPRTDVESLSIDSNIWRIG